MPLGDAPRGERFSQVYLERGEPTEDSPRMRRRLAALTESVSLRENHELAQFATQQLGVDIPTIGTGWRSFPNFLRDCDLRDALDLVTVAFRYFYIRDRTVAGNIVRGASAIFREENLHYTVDDQGGVHLTVDDEFARSKGATIAALQANRYANALHAFD